MDCGVFEVKVRCDVLVQIGIDTFDIVDALYRSSAADCFFLSNFGVPTDDMIKWLKHQIEFDENTLQNIRSICGNTFGSVECEIVLTFAKIQEAQMKLFKVQPVIDGMSYSTRRDFLNILLTKYSGSKKFSLMDCIISAVHYCLK